METEIIRQFEYATAYLNEARIAAATDNKTFADISAIIAKIERLKKRLQKRMPKT